MSSSPRRDTSHKTPTGMATESVTRHTSNQFGEGEVPSTTRNSELRKSPKQALKPRPSRWADEVDEDDQFIPSGSQQKVKPAVEATEAPAPRVRQPIPLRRQSSKEEGRYARNTRDQAYPSKAKPAFDSRSVKRETPVPQRQRSPKQPVSSKEQIEEIAHMKEVMAKKAEEKKRLKQEEEARIEAERRARCEAKLREMEEKQKQKLSSGASTPVAYTPVVDPELEAKRAAFNQRRFEVRQKREGKPVGVPSPLAPSSPTVGPSNTSPTRLSPHAAEFVPNIQHPPPPPSAYYHPMPQHMHHPHWMAAAPPHAPPPYYGAPQMWHHPQWPPHGVAPPYGAHPGGYPGHPGHQFPPSPAPQQYDPRDI